MASRAPDVVDRPLPRAPAEVSSSAFAFLFAEVVKYSQDRVQRISDLERKLEDLGHGVGARAIELTAYREHATKREIRLIQALQFVAYTLWKNLFGVNADSLEKSTQQDDEFMISEHGPLTTRYISVPRDMGQLNCGAFGAGVIRGALHAAGLPCTVSAHFVDNPAGDHDKTVYLIKFEPQVMRRESRLG